MQDLRFFFLFFSRDGALQGVLAELATTGRLHISLGRGETTRVLLRRNSDTDIPLASSSAATTGLLEFGSSLDACE